MLRMMEWRALVTELLLCLILVCKSGPNQLVFCCLFACDSETGYCKTTIIINTPPFQLKSDLAWLSALSTEVSSSHSIEI